MLILLAIHVVVAAAAGAIGHRAGRRIFFLGAIAPAAAVAWGLAAAGEVIDGGAVASQIEWASQLGLDIGFRVDGFGLVMLLLVGGVGVLIMLYSYWYFADRPGLGRFTTTLVGFAGSMLGLVTADNLILLLVFWELTSVTSYLLIGFEDEKASARSAALQALLVTAGGGLAMLAGVVLVASAAGTYSLAEIIASPPQGAGVGVGLVLILVGAFTKSAQVPFHFWLPAAMAAPTPVSAYLHSATMVKGGVYLVARLAPAFALLIDYWRPLVIGVGLASMLVGGYKALLQTDLKLVLALGTVSQLGLMIALFGVGEPEFAAAATLILVAHGLFKAALFMVVGIIDRQSHTRDLRRLSGLGRRMPATAAGAVVATASMVGLPPLLGFVAKEAALETFLRFPVSGAGWATAGAVAGSVFTAAYGARLLWGAFATKAGPSLVEPVGDGVRAPRVGFVAPVLLLSALTVLWGLWPRLIEGWIGSSARSLTGESGPRPALWHGIGPPLLFSALAVGAGLLIAARPGLVRGSSNLTHRLPSSAAIYQKSLHGLNRLSDLVTGAVQPGSLPFYGGVILLAALVLPGWHLFRSWTAPAGLVVAESPLQMVAAVVVVAAGVGAAFTIRRLAAVIFMGAVGYGVAVLFVIQGAPDLALTQMLVETMAIAIFVLVLRHLPKRFEPSTFPVQRITRLAVAGAVGAFITIFTIYAAGARQVEPVSTAMVERALSEAGGANVVNVILTDFRSLDTLGEITVLAVAALGILALIRAGRPPAGMEEG